MKYLSSFCMTILLLLLPTISNSINEIPLSPDSCQMALVLDKQVISVFSPKQSINANIKLPIGKSTVRLNCTLTQQAIFSFERDEIVSYSWENPQGRITQLVASSPSFVLPVGKFIVDFEIISHQENIQQFVWQDFASYLDENLINNIIIGVFYGLCITLIMYVFFMGRMLGDKRFELYSFYVFCAATFFLLQEGLLNIFLPSFAFLFGHQLYLIFAGLTVFSAILFIVRITDLHLKWHKTVHYILQPSAALVLLIAIALVFMDHNALSSTLNNIMAKLTLLIMIITLGLIIKQVFDKVKLSFLVLVSLLLMVAAMSLRVVFVEVSPFLTRYALIFAFSIEAFILAVAVSTRIKELKIEKNRAQLDANTDVLCKILNRRGWEQKASELIEQQKRIDGVLSLFYIDLNDFKIINDTYGHDRGDQILQIFAKIIKNQIRSRDIVGRVGGDEFVAIGLFESERVANLHALRLNARLREVCVRISGHENVKVSASVGHVVFDTVPNSIGEMLDSADKSMYLAKNEKKAKFSKMASY